ncbi:MAG: putative metal-dependent hydrolase [Caldilineaceae bacterium]|nr:putative metal-dependent hydrolase [Caldilineaceae bacterium]
MTAQEHQPLIDKIRHLPSQIEALVGGLSETQRTTPFLAGEWTVAQNVHHLADSHMNSYLRCKLILTEDHPTLKPYDQDAWAQLPDAQVGDLTPSLLLLKQLHNRWVTFWETLPATAWQRTGFHPENGTVTLEEQLRLYAAHGEAHIDQITRTLAAA